MHLGVLEQVHNGFRDYKKKKHTHTHRKASEEWLVQKWLPDNIVYMSVLGYEEMQELSQKLQAVWNRESSFTK